MTSKSQILLLILSSYGFVANAANRNKLTNEPAGVITFENSSVDFGSIRRGQKLTAKFAFKNTGAGPLSIQGIQASCDCTTVEANKGKVIAPGESGVIEVVFDSKDYAGQVSKAITVVTNERTMPHRTLTLAAVIKSDLEADPPLIDFGDILVSQVSQQKIRVKNLMKMDLNIENLRFNEDILEATYAKDGRDWVIQVKLKPTAHIGFIKETIYVKTNSASLPEMPIPVRVNIKGQISTSPAYVEFGSIPSKGQSTRPLSLDASEPFEVLAHKVELNINGVKTQNSDKLIKVSVAPTEKNGKKLSLDLVNPGDSLGSVHGKVYLETTNPQQKNIVVDFYAFFR